jgi:hypothetical protein
MLARRVLAGAATAALFLVACSSTTGPGDASDVTAVEAAADVQPDVQQQPDVPPSPSGVGNPCTGSGGFPPDQGDCADGQICLPDQFGFGGGYCSADCTSARCPSDSICVRIGGQFSICMLTCSTNSDCRVMDGYVCQGADAAHRVCTPNDAPSGTRDGMACYTTTAGAHQLPALPRRTFTGANLSASAERTDTQACAEGNVAINPMNGAVVDSYIAETRGAVFMGTTVTRDGTALIRTGAARDPQNSLTSDPVIAYTSDNVAHMVYLGYRQGANGQPSAMRVRVADSMDDGASWTNVRAVEPDGTCNGTTTTCDKPWMIAGPSPDGMSENLYVTFMQQNNTAGTVRLVILRSEDHGTTWSAPVTIGGIEVVAGSQIVPNLNTIVVGADGRLHVVYNGLGAAGSQSSRFGDTINRIVYRTSMDGGRTWSPAHSVARAMDSPVYEQPIVGVDGSTIYVAYVGGPQTGAWDLYLATSTNGGTSWTYRKVNDEPDSCASHALPWMVADTQRHVAHVVWLENRFGDGALAYARCPQDATMPCTANEQITDAPFTFTTSRDPSVWHGDYLGIAIAANGDPWVSWSDTRTGGPQMYLAHGHIP